MFKTVIFYISASISCLICCESDNLPHQHADGDGVAILVTEGFFIELYCQRKRAGSLKIRSLLRRKGFNNKRFEQYVALFQIKGNSNLPAYGALKKKAGSTKNT